MNIRKVILAITAAVAMAIAPAAEAQFRYGPMVGANLSTFHFKQDLFTIDRSVSGSAGLVTEMMFPGLGFGIDFGLYYQQLGATLHLGEREFWASQGYASPRMRMHYVTVPFHLRYKQTRLNGLEDYIAPFAYVGPSFDFLAAHSGLKAFDFAGAALCVDFGAGFEICRRFQISASYNVGMTYALKAKVLSNFSAKNRNWALRFAWLF